MEALLAKPLVRRALVSAVFFLLFIAGLWMGLVEEGFTPLTIAVLAIGVVGFFGSSAWTAFCLVRDQRGGETTR